MGLRDLPQGNGERHARCFERFGWSRRPGKRKSSHIILVKQGEVATLSIPNHKGTPVKRVLVAKLIKAAGISEREYCDKFK